jgi:hypothetical protein
LEFWHLPSPSRKPFGHARAYYRLPKARFEVLVFSPVKIRIDEFNQPVLGDRVWGTYNTFQDIYRKNLLDLYALRHQQNRPGGFTTGSRAAGTDRIAVNTFGLRLAGPLVYGVKQTVEVAAQTGMVGLAEHRAVAWFAGLSRRWQVAGKPLDISGEYKFSSGTQNPKDTLRSGTFDQLSPANHDKFGHEDLFGWRNLRNIRSLGIYGVTKAFAINVMYNYWLARPAIPFTTVPASPSFARRTARLEDP